VAIGFNHDGILTIGNAISRSVVQIGFVSLFWFDLY